MATSTHKNQTSIFDLSKPAATTGLAKERHPLPPVHYSPDQLAAPEDIAKALSDLHETVRKATLPSRTDPSSGPTYVRSVAFTRPATSSMNTAVTVTATVAHNLGAAPTIVHSTRATGDPAYHPVVVTNPTGVDNTRFTVVSVTLPAGSNSVTHDLKLGG